MQYYKTCWDHRNEVAQDEEKQREQVLVWYNNVKLRVEIQEPMQVRLFAIRNKIQPERTRTESIVQWIYNVLKMMRKVEKLLQNDIMRYFGFVES